MLDFTRLMLISTQVEVVDEVGVELGNYIRKSYVLVKVVRAKLPSTLEGDGVGGKNIQTNNFFDKWAHFYHNPPGE